MQAEHSSRQCGVNSAFFTPPPPPSAAPPPQSSPWRPSRIYGYRWGCRKWSRFTALQKWWRPTAAIPTDFVTEKKELRPRDSRQGSLQTGEICTWEDTIALFNTILRMLSEGDGTNTFILLQLVSRSHSRICQTTSAHRFEFAWVT